MDGDLLRVLLIVLVVGGIALWVASSLLIRVSGTWVRELDPDDLARGERPERIEFTAAGPLVSGRSEVGGGHQEYGGYILGRTMHLKRRDHGVRHLMNQGYPQAIAAKRDGEEAARLKLRLDEDRLVGEFVGQKIEFTHQPPRVTGVLPLAPQPRSYSRLASVGEEELSRVPNDVEEPVELA